VSASVLVLDQFDRSRRASAKTPHLIHYGSWKDCALRNRCNPSIYRSSWCQAFYRLHVRICFPIITFVRSRETSFLFLFLFFSPDTEYISNPTVRSWTERYLGVGETMFNTLQGAVVTSPYFKRSERR